MADFHSGDDLSAAARQAIGRATGGRNHFKVSPNLQLLFAEVLAEHHPDLFRRWWQDALAYAQREAAAGSAFAARVHPAVRTLRQALVARRDLPPLQLCVRRPAGRRRAVHLPRGVLRPVAGVLPGVPGVHRRVSARAGGRSWQLGSTGRLVDWAGHIGVHLPIYRLHCYQSTSLRGTHGTLSRQLQPKGNPGGAVVGPACRRDQQPGPDLPRPGRTWRRPWAPSWTLRRGRCSRR